MAKARVEDVHAIALSLPGVTMTEGSKGNPVYQVGRRSFVFFRNPRKDAVDHRTGERYTDVIVFWVGSQQDKEALLAAGEPFFTTPHFTGHPSVLVRASRIGLLGRSELAEVIQDAWLARAPTRLARDWLAAHSEPPA
ncbi:MAG: MmcQ/YjbR family DNA-binding protein [Dermatophilaceae bacterium]